jgi:hypothetical protein
MISLSSPVLAWQFEVVAQPNSKVTAQPDKVVCRYVNHMQQIQILRIANIPNWFFERTVLPGEELLFEAYPEAELEVYTYEIASAILTEKITCDRLALHQKLCHQL